jgi:hypothetical protein
MKGCKFFQVALLALAGIFCFAGCETTNTGETGELNESGLSVTKTRGVYTTLKVDGQNIDMPASSYNSWKTFGLGQTPAAVVVGYGDWDGSENHAQTFELQAVETANGAVIFDQNGEVFAGKAAVFKLPIRKSGDYQLKLIINGSVDDTWNFTVNREGGSSTTNPPVYAKGNFSVSIEASAASDVFGQYDDSLINAMLAAITKDADKSNQDIFAQVTPGHVVVEFNLNKAGQVDSPKIIENTLTDEFGQFFLHALQNGSPYATWPDAVRAAFGSDTRDIKATFYFD